MDVASIPRQKKDAFLRQMSEDDFRDRLLRPLFYRLGYKDGRDLCGPFEKGKDAVFLDENRLGKTDVIAVQTKKGNLTLASKASASIITAITQLRTALETQIAFPQEKRKVLPSKVFLCASGRINDGARTHICDTITDPRITFLDSDDLIPLVDESFPEFWLHIDADLQPYFRAMKELVEGKPLVHGNAPVFRSDILIGAATDANYIELTVFRTTLKTQKIAGQMQQRPVIEDLNIEQLIKRKEQRILLLGEAGAGKSTALLRLAYQAARRGVTSARGYRIPVLLQATDLSKNPSQDIEVQIDSYTRQVSGASRPCFTHDDLAAGRTFLLIDALDEVPALTEKESLLERVNLFAERYPRVQIILTSRPYQFVNEIPALSRYLRFEISPIGWREARRILRSLQKGKRLPLENGQELLRRLQQVHGIELNPLLVTVFAATAEYSRQDIPANITELFKKFTELLLGRWDENKGLNQQYQAPLKDFLITRIAFDMHRDRQTRISLKEFARRIAKELVKRGHESSQKIITEEIVFRSGLFRVISEQVEFRHHLLQEFFAGRGIDDPQDIELLIADEWWQRPIVFYFGEHPDTAGDLVALAEKVEGGSATTIYESARTIGLSLQACYLSEVTQKIDLWKQVATLISSTRDDMVATDHWERYPLSGFLAFFMFARDALALSNIRDSVSELRDWARQRTSASSSDQQEIRTFWLIVGLIELGEVEMAQDLISVFKPSDPRHLVALHLGAHLAEHVRALGHKEKRVAARICNTLDPAVEPFREQIVKELGSQLLEVRRGAIMSVEADTSQTTSLGPDEFELTAPQLKP
jgi:energy-coupling factor transporter ATP-binding protein EcfA2